MSEKKAIRIILTEDGGQLTNWPMPPTEKIVEDFVAGYTGQGVDVFSYSLQGGHMASYDSNFISPQYVDAYDNDRSRVIGFLAQS